MSDSDPSPARRSEDADPLAHAHAALAASEARYRALVSAFSEAVWSVGPVSDFEPGVEWWCALTGQSRDEAANDGWFNALHPDDRRRAIDTWHRVQATGEPYEIDYRVRTATGDYRWFAVRGVPIGDSENRGWIGSFTDITERQRAETTLRETTDRLHALSRRLLEIQEQERRFIAAELHDEVGQLLTGLLYQLELAKNQKDCAPLDIARSIVQDLSSRIRELSQQLRPTVLDDLGLIPAVHWLAERVQLQNGLTVALDGGRLIGRLPPAVETAAFRIIQEALTNVARHAEVPSAAVRLARNSDALVVEVVDHGCGFAPAALDQHATSGVSGMRERAEWLGGHLTLESSPGQGTRLVAVLPIAQSAPAEK